MPIAWAVLEAECHGVWSHGLKDDFRPDRSPKEGRHVLFSEEGIVEVDIMLDRENMFSPGILMIRRIKVARPEI